MGREKVSKMKLITVTLSAVLIGACTDEKPPAPKVPQKAEKTVGGGGSSKPATKKKPGKTTKKPAAVKINPVKMKTIGRLAAGMRRIVARRDRGFWYKCGKSLDSEEQVDESIQIAWKLLEEMTAVGLTHISPWGIIGTMYNESRFDPCALGINPRKTAYKAGYLEPKKQGISHSKKDILAAIQKPEMKSIYAFSGYDLGFCQVLTRFYPHTSFDYIMTVAGGTRICALEMHARARANKTKRPWLFWRGTKSTAWYGAKISRWVHEMKGRK